MGDYCNKAVKFECEGQQLIGVATIPDNPRPVAMIAIVAGGPQYRGGVGRNLVDLSRVLAAQGITMLRFDYRGMGDSDGEFNNFLSIKPEIEAATDFLKRIVPEIKDVVLWGGCNAASSIMIFGAQVSGISGMIVSNPYVDSRQHQAKAQQAHYLRRLMEPTFWRKLFSGQYAIGAQLSELWQMVKSRLQKRSQPNTANSNSSVEKPFQVRMLEGFGQFEGVCLLVASGRSVDAQSFQYLVDSSAQWQAAIGRASVDRLSLPEADQGFSAHSSRNELFSEAVSWFDKHWPR